MRRPHAFVTGAAGFVGRHLAAELCASGWDVTALVRKTWQHAGVRELGVEVVTGDLADRGGRWTAAITPDTVTFHLAAAMTTLRDGIEDGRSMTANLLAAMTAAGASRLIAVSSAAVHGPHPALVRVDETSPTGPHPLWDHYARQKAAVEATITSAGKTDAVAATIVRPTRVIGPGDAGLLRLIARLETSVAGEFADDYDCRHPVVVVDDLVAGLRACATEASTAGKVYYLSSAHEITKRQLIAAFMRAGMPPPRRSTIKSVGLGPARAGVALLNAPWQLAGRRSSGPRAVVTAALEKRAGRPVDHDCTISCARAALDFGWSGSADLEKAIADAVRWDRAAASRSSEPSASPS